MLIDAPPPGRAAAIQQWQEKIDRFARVHQQPNIKPVTLAAMLWGNAYWEEEDIKPTLPECPDPATRDQPSGRG